MKPDKLIRGWKELVEATRLSESTLRRKLDNESRIYDPTFPQPRKLTGDGGKAIGWREDEVQKWIDSLSQRAA